MRLMLSHGLIYFVEPVCLKRTVKRFLESLLRAAVHLSGTERRRITRLLNREACLHRLGVDHSSR
jgi:hypothetical protein